MKSEPNLEQRCMVINPRNKDDKRGHSPRIPCLVRGQSQKSKTATQIWPKNRKMERFKANDLTPRYPPRYLQRPTTRPPCWPQHETRCPRPIERRRLWSATIHGCRKGNSEEEMESRVPLPPRARPQYIQGQGPSPRPGHFPRITQTGEATGKTRVSASTALQSQKRSGRIGRVHGKRGATGR